MSEVAAIRTAIEGVASRNLGKESFERVSIREDVDHAGDDALFVDIAMKPANGRLSSEDSVKMRVEVSNALLSIGETRFPYLTFSYPDDIPAVDDLRETESKYSTRRAS
ncbi:hypothetical protein [Methylocystis parvus]|uniref:Ribosome-binding factor A n=1 Tax=Methylocystis parvus TaxID=134 RepID=A0A6B8M520_9HYPH|nr:hypothetical protein [Methylocystis parvus]QGM98031.1 hypothetical protein F7D14_11450 [Methylocystis parvus]WBK01653.1 hypothetical protein MMG94_08125 [Methylocystis parvus OBBP]